MLHRPSRLAEDRWAAIEAHLSRLILAESSNDPGLIVGLSKDLVETIAKIVCAQMSVAGPPESDARGWLQAAQDAVAGKVGTGDAGRARKLLGIMAKGATVLVEARNQVGSGHGHVTVPAVQLEDALVAADFARAWAQWILRLTDRALEDRVGDLVDRLSGGTFYAGDLARALNELDLPSLPPQDQRRIGVAVGRRSIGETFNVIREGLRPLRARQTAFPRDYQHGLAEGLLLDVEGRVADFRGFEGDVGAIVAYLEREAATEILASLHEATWSHRLSMDESARSQLASKMRLASPTLPPDLQREWDRFADRLEPVIDGGFFGSPDDDNWNDDR